MINLNQEEIKLFQQRGWLKTSLNLSNSEISLYSKAAKQIVKKAKKDKYPYGRVYFDYIFDFNLAAVELPLNNKVCNEEIYNFFQKIKIGCAVNKLLKTEDSICLLNRLFCMGPYNYTGHMHKDTENENKRIQVMIYLKDESGFKIIEKDKEKNLMLKMFGDNKLKTSPNFTLPLKFPETNLSSIDEKAGEILFFDPALSHQGVYKGSRLNFHMRFEKLENHRDVASNKKYFDYHDIKEYEKDFDITSKNIKFPKVLRQNLLRRTVNTINYYFPIVNFLRLAKLKKNKEYKNYKFNFLDNTLYQ